jgi:arginyl-tRNA synthetase
LLSLEGNSSPYLQYTYVRLRSILKKAKSFKKFDQKLLREGKELQIIRKIDAYPNILEKVIDENQTNFLTSYLFELAELINNYYESFSILKSEKNIKLARLNLIKVGSIVLKSALNLLGIEVLEKM